VFILGWNGTWRSFQLSHSWSVNLNAMSATFISHECKHEQSKHHDQDNALFAFGKIENAEQAFHFVA
jgi:hypothetical protein